MAIRLPHTTAGLTMWSVPPEIAAGRIVRPVGLDAPRWLRPVSDDNDRRLLRILATQQAT